VARELLYGLRMSELLNLSPVPRAIEPQRPPERKLENGLLNVSEFHRALDYHSERHNVLASNLANANTPGFRPKELLRVEDTAFGGTLPLARTEHAHLVSDGGMPGIHDMTVVPDDSTVNGLDGNNVSLEREMSKLQANDLRFQGAARLVTRQLAMLRYAANDGGAG
jgi:flagellar basal-body rod protein FlgB